MEKVTDNLKVKGKIRMVILRKDGRVEDHGWQDNLIVNTGKEYFAKLLNGVSVAPFTYIALGSGSTAAAAGDTALVTEITDGGLARAAATCTYVASYTAQLVKTFTLTGTRTFREIGIFNAASTGQMASRKVFAGDITLESGDQVQFTWQYIVGTA